MTEEEVVDAGEMYDVLLTEIAAAEDELRIIQEQLKNQPEGSSLSRETAALEQETALLEKEVLVGLVDDDKTRYYLAVGELEEQVKSLREIKETNESINRANLASLEAVKADIKSQTGINQKLDKKIATLMNGLVGQEELRNLTARGEMNEEARANKIILSQMKGELKIYLDDREKLNPNHIEGEGSQYGHLLQTLWSNFLKNEAEYVSIEGLNYDVTPVVLDHLVSAGIAIVHLSDPDKIKMEDFTCKD